MKISKKRRLLVYEKYGGKCAYCGIKLEISEMHIDHINPLFRKSLVDSYHLGHNKNAGRNLIENMNPSCSKCNYTKHCRTIEDFRKYLNNKLLYLMEHESTFRMGVALDVIKVSKFTKFYYETIEEVE